MTCSAEMFDANSDIPTNGQAKSRPARKYSVPERLLPTARAQVDAALAGFTTGQNDFPAVIGAERGLRDIELAAFRAHDSLPIKSRRPQWDEDIDGRQRISPVVE